MEIRSFVTADNIVLEICGELLEEEEEEAEEEEEKEEDERGESGNGTKKTRPLGLRPLSLRPTFYIESVDKNGNVADQTRYHAYYVT